MNKKQVIRINEDQLKQIVMESVKRALNEGDLLNWKQDAKNRVYVNPDGTTRPMVYTTDTLKDDLINYLQDYYDIWSLDEFRKLPKDEQKEILRKFYGDRNNGRKVKDREPKGSWINGEWWDGYIA